MASLNLNQIQEAASTVNLNLVKTEVGSRSRRYRLIEGSKVVGAFPNLNAVAEFIDALKAEILEAEFNAAAQEAEALEQFNAAMQEIESEDANSTPVTANESKSKPAVGLGGFRKGSKGEKMYIMLTRPEGATVQELSEALTWTRSSVKSGFTWDMKNRGYKVEKIEGETYCIRQVDR